MLLQLLWTSFNEVTNAQQQRSLPLTPRRTHCLSVPTSSACCVNVKLFASHAWCGGTLIHRDATAMQWYFDGRKIRTMANEYHQLYALPCTREGHH